MSPFGGTSQKLKGVNNTWSVINCKTSVQLKQGGGRGVAYFNHFQSPYLSLVKQAVHGTTGADLPHSFRAWMCECGLYLTAKHAFSHVLLILLVFLHADLITIRAARTLTKLLQRCFGRPMRSIWYSILYSPFFKCVWNEALKQSGLTDVLRF